MTKNKYLLYKQAQMDFSFMGPAPDDPNVAKFYMEQQGVPAHSVPAVPTTPPPTKPSFWSRIKELLGIKKAPQPQMPPRPEEYTPLPRDAWHMSGLGM